MTSAHLDANLANSFFIATQAGVHSVCFSQTFCCILTQIVQRRPVTTTNTNMQQEDIIYSDMGRTKGVSYQPYSAPHNHFILFIRCRDRGLCAPYNYYVNNITENFEGRVKYFWKYKISKKISGKVFVRLSDTCCR
jgi:hypothetical protein